MSPLAQRYPDVVAELARRGGPVDGLFDAMVATAELYDPAHQPLRIVDAGKAWFVRWTWELAMPDSLWSDFVLVNDAFEAKHRLDLFAQLLMNGACALDDVAAVVRVVATTSTGRVIATREEADALAAQPGNIPGDPRLAEQWEPPHREGRLVRFCFDDERGHFAAVSVDSETCAVALEPRCKAPVWFHEGRTYRDDDERAVAAALVTHRLVEAKLRRRLHARLRLP